MKLQIISVFAFVIICSTGLLAQNISDLPSNSFPFNLGAGTMMKFDKRYAGVKGTYTFFEAFTPGTVELKKGTFSNVLINYDAYSDNLLAINDKLKDTVQLRKDLVTAFVMKRESAEDVLFVKKGLNGVPTFLNELVRDSVSLYCKISKTIKKAEIGGAYNVSENKYDQFVTVNTFYIERNPNELTELKKGKKGIINTFPEFEKQLSEYLKTNKPDLNDYRHMKVLFQYINTL